MISVLHVCPCLGFVGMMFVFKEHCLHDSPFQQQANMWDESDVLPNFAVCELLKTQQIKILIVQVFDFRIAREEFSSLLGKLWVLLVCVKHSGLGGTQSWYLSL